MKKLLLSALIALLLANMMQVAVNADDFDFNQQVSLFGATGTLTCVTDNDASEPDMKIRVYLQFLALDAEKEAQITSLVQNYSLLAFSAAGKDNLLIFPKYAEFEDYYSDTYGHDVSLLTIGFEHVPSLVPITNIRWKIIHEKYLQAYPLFCSAFRGK